VAALGGPEVPGIGFALGVDRLAMVLGEDVAVAGPEAVVLPLGEEALGPAFDLATRLRSAGVTVGIEPPGRTLKALLRTADRQGARCAVIVGEDEMREGRATVRDLERRMDRPRVLPFDAAGPELAHAIRVTGEPPRA
jgi:histidyl-tRNA synthetase